MGRSSEGSILTAAPPDTLLPPLYPRLGDAAPKGDHPSTTCTHFAAHAEGAAPKLEEAAGKPLNATEAQTSDTKHIPKASHVASTRAVNADHATSEVLLKRSPGFSLTKALTQV